MWGRGAKEGRPESQEEAGEVGEGAACTSGHNWKAIAGVGAGDSERVRTHRRAVKRKRNGHMQRCGVDSIWRIAARAKDDSGKICRAPSPGRLCAAICVHGDGQIDTADRRGLPAGCYHQLGSLQGANTEKEAELWGR